MHELSICLALVQQVEEIAQQRAAKNVASILLRVGPLSGIEPGLLRRAFPLAATGTIAEFATLEIETPEVTIRCTQCGHESLVPPNRLLCESCGDFRTQLQSGDEMILQSLRLDLENVRQPSPEHAAG